MMGDDHDVSHLSRFRDAVTCPGNPDAGLSDPGIGCSGSTGS
jgi:hypothetical protein